MKISEAIKFCLQYQKANSKVNTVKNYEFVLGKLGDIYNDRELETITTEEVLSFLTGLSDGRKQNTKRGRYCSAICRGWILFFVTFENDAGCSCLF